MKKNSGLWILVVGFVVMMVFGLSAYRFLSGHYEKEPTQSVEAERIEAPDFMVYDNDGKTVRLSDFKGKPVVLNFWASWCGPCRKEMPDFQELYEVYGDDVTFMMINMTDGKRETLDLAREFVANQELNLPIYFDLDYDVMSTYGVRSLPTTYVLDEEGYLIEGYRGMISKEQLEKVLKNL